MSLGVEIAARDAQGGDARNALEMKRGLLGEERRLDDLPDLDALLPVDPGNDVDHQLLGMSGRLVHEALPQGERIYKEALQNPHL